MINDVVHLFVGLMAICISSLKKCIQFFFLVHFFNQVICPFDAIGVFYIFEILVAYWIDCKHAHRFHPRDNLTCHPEGFFLGTLRVCFSSQSCMKESIQEKGSTQCDHFVLHMFTAIH